MKKTLSIIIGILILVWGAYRVGHGLGVSHAIHNSEIEVEDSLVYIYYNGQCYTHYLDDRGFIY